MTEITITECEEGDFYLARAHANGRIYSRTFWRGPAGWPPDYKQRAHAEIKRAIAEDEASENWP